MLKLNQTTQNLRYLFDRPCQPCFQEKGLNGDVAFDVPPEYLAERYKTISNQLTTRFNPNQVTTIKVGKLTTLPDISAAESLDKRENFSLFNLYHQQCAANLIEVFVNMKNVDDLMSLAIYAQQRVNPYLFIYALSVAMLHRPDTISVDIPSHMASFPDLYINNASLNDARKTTNIPSGSRDPIDISKNLTASIADPESRAAYFREDIGVNLHHWHWHLVYPNQAPASIVKKDRRGELFYYMHEQLLARYNFERFSNNLPRTKPIENFDELIPEGYFPKLDSVIASRTWASRQAHSRINNLDRKDQSTVVSIKDMNKWRDRIYEAIERGNVIKGSGSELIQLTEKEGIDILGNLIEASSISINQNFYGNYHNQGHLMIAYLHDPDNRFQEGPGVMGDSATAMRDPIFYRWHASINEMFDAYKRTLSPYTKEQLEFSGIKLTKLEVKCDTAKRNNTFFTHWETDEIELSRGLDFTPRGSVKAKFNHLQHRSFSYRINVENSSGRQRVGTVRIFLAPKNDERRFEMRFNELRTFFIEMDRFTETLKTGTNEIIRNSKDSSVTIPFEVSFRDLERTPSTASSDGVAQASRSNFVYCGCGWPDHMLVPKGTADGLPCILFAMITDFESDKVDNLTMDANHTACDNAFSFCGVRNNRYPDRKAMGFPFDRIPRPSVVTLQQFLTSNMMIQNVSVVHQNAVLNGTTLRSSNSNTKISRKL